MKIDRKDLIKKLQSLSKVISKKSNHEILQDAKFEFAGTQGKVVCTDLENWLEFNLEFFESVAEPQGGAVNCANLLQIIKSLNEDVIDIKFKDETFDTKYFDDDKEVIRQDIQKKFVINDTFILPVMDTENYPIFNFHETALNNITLEIDSKTLINLVDKVSYAVACKADNHKILEYVLFRFLNNKLRIISTDGKRLAIVEYPLEKTVEKTFDFLVKPELINVLKSITGKHSKNLKIEFEVFEEKSYVFLKDAVSFVLISRLENLQYPNIDGIMPGSEDNKALGLIWDKILKVKVTTLLPVVKQLQAFYGKLPKNDTPIFALSITSNEFKISAKKGDDTVKIPVSNFNYVGKPIVIGINGSFLADILGTMCGEITIRMCTPRNAIVFYGEVGHLGLVMPMNLIED